MDHLCVIHPFLLGLNQSANGLLATFERPFLADSPRSGTPHKRGFFVPGMTGSGRSSPLPATPATRIQQDNERQVTDRKSPFNAG
jgi:hypothetical protein